MTKEPTRKIPDGLEHPAARAAKMIKQLHQDTIKLLDSGKVFTKDGVNVNYEIRDACLKQIDMCDKVIERAPDMPVSLAGEAFMILRELEEVVDSRKTMKLLPDEPSTTDMPEIGNYDHKKT